MGKLFKIWQPEDGGALAVAEHLLHRAEALGRTLTPMQVLKLIYIGHGWMLALHGRPLFDDEIEAWKYGPVVPAVYWTYSPFGSERIDTASGSREDVLDEDKRDMIEAVLRRYDGYTGIELSDMTHRPGSPWDKTRKARQKVIPNDVIALHYEDKLRQARKRQAG